MLRSVLTLKLKEAIVTLIVKDHSEHIGSQNRGPMDDQRGADQIFIDFPRSPTVCQANQKSKCESQFKTDNKTGSFPGRHLL